MVEVIAPAEVRAIGAPTLVEAAAVMLARKGPQARSHLMPSGSGSIST